MGTLSLRYAEPLITRFGARRDADARPRPDSRRWLLLFPQAPVDGVYAVDILPVMVLLGAAPACRSRR